MAGPGLVICEYCCGGMGHIGDDAGERHCDQIVGCFTVKRFGFKKDVGKNVGYTLFKESGKLINSSKVTVILRHKTYNGMPYFILTAYLDV